MNLSDLKSILYTAEKGNISKAADELGLSQPALSKLIKNIESQLRIKLFSRRPRGVELTAEGQIYVEHFKNILDELKSAKQEVNKLHSGYTDHIEISAHPILAKYFIPKLDQALIKFPKLDLSYKFQNSRAGIEDVLAGDVDIAIAADVKDYPDLVRIKLWQEFIGLYSKDGHIKKCLILNSQMISSQKALAQIKPESHKTINDYSIISSLLKNNRYMGLLPNPIADNEKKLSLIEQIGPTVDISLVYRADKVKTQGFKKLVQLLKTSYK